nr:MAG TPA: hypothetical protein [Caudoviricetes sp.]
MGGFRYSQLMVALVHCKHRNTRELYRHKYCVAMDLWNCAEVWRSFR